MNCWIRRQKVRKMILVKKENGRCILTTNVHVAQAKNIKIAAEISDKSKKMNTRQFPNPMVKYTNAMAFLLWALLLCILRRKL